MATVEAPADEVAEGVAAGASGLGSGGRVPRAVQALYSTQQPSKAARLAVACPFNRRRRPDPRITGLMGLIGLMPNPIPPSRSQIHLEPGQGVAQQLVGRRLVARLDPAERVVEHEPEVVGVLDGEFTLKRLRKDKGKFYLQAENDAYPDLFALEELQVAGVVRGVMRKY